MKNSDPRTSLTTVDAPAPATSDLWLNILLRAVERIDRGLLSITLPDGTRRVCRGKHEDGPTAALVLHTTRAARRLILAGGVGFAEAYMDGDWDSPDLASLLELAAVNETRMGAAVIGRLPLRLWHAAYHRLRPNTRRGSRRNIAAHYDLGNDFYRRWLDPSMTYSAALFTSPDQALEDAQLAKYRRICDQLGLRPGHHVLEIGCGWGGFAEVAARDYGCRVTGITLSREQLAYARERIRQAHLSDRVDFRLQDYRNTTGTYDRIVSIEMFEAVGENYWPRYFETLRERLEPDGLAALQIITIDDARFESYRRSADFIQRYIFPGGMLPSPAVLRQTVIREGFEITDALGFGHDYARTLAEWNQCFRQSWPEIEPLGFDARFKRMWEFYLAYCEGGFRAGSIDVTQLVIRPA